MVKFFQIVFLIASVILIVVNVMQFSRWQEARKEGSIKPVNVNWFTFVLTSLVAVGCALNILVQWISKA